MKRIKVRNAQESLILTGMIVSDRVLRDVQSVLDLKLFDSTYGKRIARWCLEYYREHEKAPGVHIEDIYKQWMEEGGDAQDDEGQLVGRTLQRISDDFGREENFNDEFVLRIAEEYFQKRDFKRLADILNNPLTSQEEGIKILEDYRPRLIPSHAGINMITDAKALRRAFEEDEKPLMTLPGAVGDLINGDLCRGHFLAFMGQEKIGKTWTLQEIAFRGVMNYLNVAFFQAGDMTESQQVRRAAIRISGRSHKRRYCGEILVPVYDCVWNQSDSCDRRERLCDIGLNKRIDKWSDIIPFVSRPDLKKRMWEENDENGYEPCEVCRRREPRAYRGALWYRKHDTGPPLTWREGIKANRTFYEKTKGHEIKLATYSNDTLRPSMIMSQLDHWAHYSSFVPDIVIVDYADILLPDDTRMEFRHQQNQIWKALRRISQDFGCLLVTATQADAAAYNQDSLDASNFSEDKRKYAHVTSVVTLNQNWAEKVAGIARWAKIFSRDEEFNTRRQVKVLQALSMGRPFIGSFF